MYGSGYYTSPRTPCKKCGKLTTYEICTDCETKIEAKREARRKLRERIKVQID